MWLCIYNIGVMVLSVMCGLKVVCMYFRVFQSAVSCWFKGSMWPGGGGCCGWLTFVMVLLVSIATAHLYLDMWLRPNRVEFVCACVGNVCILLSVVYILRLPVWRERSVFVTWLKVWLLAVLWGNSCHNVTRCVYRSENVSNKSFRQEITHILYPILVTISVSL